MFQLSCRVDFKKRGRPKRIGGRNGFSGHPSILHLQKKAPIKTSASPTTSKPSVMKSFRPGFPPEGPLLKAAIFQPKGRHRTAQPKPMGNEKERRPKRTSVKTERKTARMTATDQGRHLTA